MVYVVQGSWFGIDWTAVAAIATSLTVILATLAASIAWFQFRAFRSEARLSRRPVLALEIKRVKVKDIMRSRGDGTFDPLYQRDIEVDIRNIGDGMALRVDVYGRIDYSASMDMRGAEASPQEQPTHRANINNIRAGDNAGAVLEGPAFPTGTPEPGRFGWVQVIAVCRDVYGANHPMPYAVSWAVDFSSGKQPATLDDAAAADLAEFT